MIIYNRSDLERWRGHVRVYVNDEKEGIDGRGGEGKSVEGRVRVYVY